MTTWTTSLTHPDEPDAIFLLREYLTELVRRYHGRPDLPGEVDAALAESPSDHLAPPTGLLLLARHDGELAGCAGLRWRPGWAELTRVYVRTSFRGRGGGAAPLAAVEQRARAAGADRIRLDTRSDLVEARALYAPQLRGDPRLQRRQVRRALVREGAPAGVDDADPTR
ncbi:acetyltransferase (GNAT) family protein [Micromonospora kangleipakensis]|uniref:Acetyltransferase (GNAT) family protein n=1 Tax=Micromonospora kangleipakensis TaxID=1077942 RepID=A0A4Q8BD87_9ACTN|nr:GNAT family N-acetyltransferase [Micromonospora kangleipakensis]RZU75844.1 acetyltransferase (GNAT) family protein [Micromonospora kangleipakensis]